MELDYVFPSLPAPLAPEYVIQYRKRLKQLGISPSIDNGIRAWRVIWRPFLPEPIPYTRADGNPGLKYKADNVCTRRFALVGSTDEESAFREAALFAAAAYREAPATIMPIVDWEQMAKARGVKLRDRYAKPALNGAIDQALALFQQGYGPRQVGEILGVDRSTASRWRSRLRKEGVLT